MTVRLEAICPRCKMKIVIFYNKGRDRVIWFDFWAAEHIHQPQVKGGYDARTSANG